jgi:hypothetical protein
MGSAHIAGAGTHEFGRFDKPFATIITDNTYNISVLLNWICCRFVNPHTSKYSHE